MRPSRSDVFLALGVVAFLAAGFRLQHRVNVLEDQLGSRAVAERSTPTIADVAAGGTYVGDLSAPVTLVVFTDYDCPFCGRFSTQVLPELAERYITPGLVRLSIRDLPLPIHPDAPTLASAARCVDSLAPAQSFAFQNALYSKTDSVVSRRIAKAADLVGVDSEAVVDCAASGRFERELTADREEARRHGITGTPTFVIGYSRATTRGAVVKGVQPIAAMASVIDSLLGEVKR